MLSNHDRLRFFSPSVCISVLQGGRVRDISGKNNRSDANLSPERTVLTRYFCSPIFLGDEEDGYDETLIPVDFKSAGQISE